MQIRTRTRTVVFTDMADYTRRTSGSDREGLRNLLASGDFAMTSSRALALCAASRQRMGIAALSG